MMWQKAKEVVESGGSRVTLNAPVERIHWKSARVVAVESAGRLFRSSQFISSMPIRDLIERLEPAPPAAVSRAASRLRYRDFLTVALIIRGKHLFPDNWIYIHDPHVKVGRIQNYKNWSPEMVPDPEMTCLGLEYFCFEGDELWQMPNDELILLGKQEVTHLGLADPTWVVGGTVLRIQKAYPIYDEVYQKALSVVREFITEIPNLQLIGRNGMHRYNNQDHSMVTGILAARNVLGGAYDLWQVNVDSDYQEEGLLQDEAEWQPVEVRPPAEPDTVATGQDCDLAPAAKSFDP
jgi:protoporphyrinogen oxidase